MKVQGKAETLENLRRRLLDDRSAAVFCDPLNIRYLTGFPIEDAMLTVFSDEAVLLTDSRYIEAATAAVDPALFLVTVPQEGQISHLAEKAAEKSVGTVFIEENSLTVDVFNRLKEKMPEAEVVGGAGNAILSLRSVKSGEEIDAMRRAQAITDEAFAHVLDFLSRRTPETTERDVSLELEFFCRKHGSEGMAFDTIAVSGKASSMPHGVPRDLPLEEGFLTMDFGARVDGYCSDMTRTVVLGKADGEMKRLYGTVLAAQSAALDAMRAGVSCRAVDKAARDVIENAGYPHGAFGHSLGHGVGLYIHEKPNLSPKAPEEIVLAPGHVVTDEPGIYLPGKYGCRIEDMIVIGEDGLPEDLTKSPKELIEL